MDVFALFANTDYTFLEITQSVEGNVISQEYTGCRGVLKIRDGLSNTDNIEQYANNDATLHIKPNEAFVTDLLANLVGHGIRASKNGSSALEYRITQIDEGFDFDTDTLHFYKLTLKRENYATWQTQPLE